MITSDEKFYAQRDANSSNEFITFCLTICGHSDEEVN